MPSTYPSPAALPTPTVTGAQAVQVATFNLQRLGLYVFNPNQAVTLWVAPLGTTPAPNGAGSVAIQPLQAVMFGPPNTPNWTAGMNAIAGAAGTYAISILEYYT